MVGAKGILACRSFNGDLLIILGRSQVDGFAHCSVCIAESVQFWTLAVGVANYLSRQPRGRSELSTLLRVRTAWPKVPEEAKGEEQHLFHLNDSFSVPGIQFAGCIVFFLSRQHAYL